MPTFLSAKLPTPVPPVMLTASLPNGTATGVPVSVATVDRSYTLSAAVMPLTIRLACRMLAVAPVGWTMV